MKALCPKWDFLQPRYVLSCGRQPFYSQFFPMLFRLPKIVLRLLIQPAFGRRIKSDRQPNCHFGADTRFTVDDARKRLSTDSKRLCRISYRDPQRIKTKLFDDFARMRRIVHQHDFASVVIFVIDNLGMNTFELECNAPVATNPN